MREREGGRLRERGLPDGARLTRPDPTSRPVTDGQRGKPQQQPPGTKRKGREETGEYHLRVKNMAAAAAVVLGLMAGFKAPPSGACAY